MTNCRWLCGGKGLNLDFVAETHRVNQLLKLDLKYRY